MTRNFNKPDKFDKPYKFDESDIPPTDPPDFVPDDEPDVPLATPEGDAEGLPDQPLQPGDIPPIERPRGNEPHYTLPLRKALD